MMPDAGEDLKGCAARTGKPASALDPLARIRSLADMPFRPSGVRRRGGCHLYFARRVTFLTCADTACRSPIEMSPVSPIEMSLRQAVVETFGVTCDDGDPNERSGTDPASYHDRLGRRPDHSRGQRGVDGSGPASGFPAASCVRC